MGFRIVFMGSDAFALPCLSALVEAGHDVLEVWATPDRPRGRSGAPQPSPVKARATSLGLPVYQPSSLRQPAEPTERLEKLAPDLAVVAAYGLFLPRAMLDAPRLGCLNVHASLLPLYRGAAPDRWALLRGETETGVTIIRLVEQMDAGPILGQRKTLIEPRERASELRERLARLGASLLLHVLSGIEEGTCLPREQDPALATYAPAFRKEDGWIDWSKGAGELDAFVRAMDPWPGAYSTLLREDKEPLRVEVLDLVPTSMPPRGPAAAKSEPGAVLQADEEGILVRCGSEAGLIRRLKPAGSRAMPAADFVRGRRVAPGDRFGHQSNIRLRPGIPPAPGASSTPEAGRGGGGPDARA